MVERTPKSAEARLNLARALAAANDPAGAVEQCGKALELQPGLRDAAWFLASLLQRYALTPAIALSPRGLRASFEFIDVDRQALSDAAIAYLKFRPPLSEAVEIGNSAGWDSAASFLIKGQGRKLLQDRLFRTALTGGVITDLDVEYLLTALRKTLLIGPEALKVKPVYEFACLLIRLCNNNGYVFKACDTERKTVAALDFDIDALFTGQTETASAFILAALYAPISDLIHTKMMACEADKILPRALRSVMADELAIRRSESEALSQITPMTQVTDATSQKVAEQYHEAPYPRWLSLQAPQPETAEQHLEKFFTAPQLEGLKGSFNVLVAGAGTCRQAIHSAIAYGPRARVLALDLSARSLAYGTRMAATLGVENIRFATGDILRIDEIDEQFDIIECAGVLHHMAEPYKAWRGLADKLRAGGIMQIGLYSAVSRRTVAALAEDPAWPGPAASNDALRAYRHTLMQRQPGEDGFQLTASIDFFATGDFRDLALHVHEKQCTIPDIRDFMVQHRLDFHGFILPQQTHEAYHTMFPDDAAHRSLDNWWAFEQANPRTFDGMYMFWCRRLDAGD